MDDPKEFSRVMELLDNFALQLYQCGLTSNAIRSNLKYVSEVYKIGKDSFEENLRYFFEIGSKVKCEIGWHRFDIPDLIMKAKALSEQDFQVEYFDKRVTVGHEEGPPVIAVSPLGEGSPSSVSYPIQERQVWLKIGNEKIMGRTK